MPKDIKTKVTRKDIRKIDKVAVGTAKIKNSVLKLKNEVRSSENEDNISTTNYAVDKTTNNVSKIAQIGMYELNEYRKNAVSETKQNLIKTKEEIKNIKAKQDIKQLDNKNIENSKLKSITTQSKRIKNIENTNITEIKNIQHKIPVSIKNAQNNGKQMIKTSESVSQNTSITGTVVKTNVQKANKILKSKAKKGIETTKKATKSVTAILKEIAKSSKAMWLFLIAGGWILFVVIIIICMIGLICNSTFGIFFSNERADGIMSIKQATIQINREFTQKLTEIQNNTTYDEYDIVTHRAKWKDIIAIYAVKVAGIEDGKEVVTLDEEKFEVLKKVFWDMNKIDTKIETVIEQHIEKDNKGKDKVVTTTKRILHITVSSKTTDEMANKYYFTRKQRKDLAELLSDKYASLWKMVLTAGSGGNSDIVEIAMTYLGNVGGEPFWSWAGFTSRVEWCACFVSFCANECGYIDSGIIPMFTACENQGVAWFQACGLWQDRGYIPSARRYYIL